MDSQQIVKTARTLIDIPYRHQGRTLRGLDCSGVVVMTAFLSGLSKEKLGLTNYPRNADGSLGRGLDEYCTELDTLQPGAIALFQLSPIPHHCGIVTRYGEGLGILHAYENVGRVREHALIDWWKNKIVKIYGFPNVNYGS